MLNLKNNAIQSAEKLPGYRPTSICDYFWGRWGIRSERAPKGTSILVCNILFLQEEKI